MAISAEAKAYVLDLFSDIDQVSTRAMMGGLCLYSDGQIFAILSSDEEIYLKADGAFADELAKEGCTKFSMTRKNGTIGTMGYWTLPDAARDDPELACDWARRAIRALD